MKNKPGAYVLLSIVILTSSLFCGYNCASKSFNNGLSYEEHLSVNPLPPRNLRGTLRTDHIELHWDTPETVTVPHNYSDIITHYKIYRGTTTENMSYLISTPDVIFKDFDISGSPQYAYEVTAIHKGDTESVPSQEIIVPTKAIKPSGVQ